MYSYIPLSYFYSTSPIETIVLQALKLFLDASILETNLLEVLLFIIFIFKGIATNSNFVIPKSLQPNLVELRYFKLFSVRQII